MPGQAAFDALGIAGAMFPNMRPQAVIDRLVITGLCALHWKPPCSMVLTVTAGSYRSNSAQCRKVQTIDQAKSEKNSDLTGSGPESAQPPHPKLALRVQ